MPQKMSKEEKKFARNFCAELRTWRRDVNLTQGDLARLMDVSPAWVSMVEKAEILPEYSMRHRLRLALEGEEFKRAARRRKRNAGLGAEREAAR